MAEELRKTKIENLIFRLNELAIKRQAVVDELWLLEKQGQDLRMELVKLITKTCEEEEKSE